MRSCPPAEIGDQKNPATTADADADTDTDTDEKEVKIVANLIPKYKHKLGLPRQSRRVQRSLPRWGGV